MLNYNSLQQVIQMPELNDLPTGSDTAMEDAGTEDQPTLSITSTRNWILYLPPEIRMIIYRDVLQLPHEIPWEFPLLRSLPNLQVLASLLRTSSLIRREAIPVFFGVNTFSFSRWSPRLAVGSSWWLIQNLAIYIQIGAANHGPRQQFLDIIHNLGNPSTIRGTLSVYITMDFPFLSFRRVPLHFYLRSLGRFTNFRAVELYLFCRGPLAPDPAIFYGLFENAQRYVLGPARPLATGHGLIFLPQQFVNAQSRREDVDWMEYLDGIRLTWRGDETDAD